MLALVKQGTKPKMSKIKNAEKQAIWRIGSIWFKVFKQNNTKKQVKCTVKSCQGTSYQPYMEDKFYEKKTLRNQEYKEYKAADWHNS